jgi:hypothetical protein
MNSGQKVRNSLSGRWGTILNGYTIEGGIWVEYEVATNTGIEVWRDEDIAAPSGETVNDEE